MQIVIDGERCLRKQLQKLFPNAIMTLDLRHAQERLWKAGRLFHEEGSEELAQWVEPLNRLLLSGRVDALLKRLRKILKTIPRHGPNTKHKRETLAKQINYFEERAEMMELVSQTTNILADVLSPDGFNVGINQGESAGAGLKEHIHAHIVPRWTGDTNFMPVFGETKVLPQSLEESWDQLQPLFQ